MPSSDSLPETDGEARRTWAVMAVVEARAMLASALDRYGDGDDDGGRAIVARALAVLAGAS